MTKQKQMTEKELTQSVELSDKELDEISGGPNRRAFDHVTYKLAYIAKSHFYKNGNGVWISGGGWKRGQRSATK